MICDRKYVFVYNLTRLRACDFRPVYVWPETPAYRCEASWPFLLTVASPGVSNTDYPYRNLPLLGRCVCVFLCD